MRLRCCYFVASSCKNYTNETYSENKDSTVDIRSINILQYQLIDWFACQRLTVRAKLMWAPLEFNKWIHCYVEILPQFLSKHDPHWHFMSVNNFFKAPPIWNNLQAKWAVSCSHVLKNTRGIPHGIFAGLNLCLSIIVRTRYSLFLII